jgi:hypothetical protein
MQAKLIIDTVMQGGSAQDVFNLLPDAHGTPPYGLRNLFGKAAHTLSSLKQVHEDIKDFQTEITATPTMTDGWTETQVAQFTRAVRRGLRMQLVKAIEEALA